jgi:hypothetical protein
MAGLGCPHEAPPTARRDGNAREPNHPRAPRGTPLSAYFDSGIITKWYLPEPDSAAALRLRARFVPPAVLTHLHRVELVTAWHLKVFRRELDLDSARQALGDLESDVEAGVWEAPEYDLGDVHSRAESLARQHAATLGTRTLDILHVAAAVLVGARDFITGDRRQASLAEACGLEVSRYRSRS